MFNNEQKRMRMCDSVCFVLRKSLEKVNLGGRGAINCLEMFKTNKKVIVCFFVKWAILCF